MTKKVKPGQYQPESICIPITATATGASGNLDLPSGFYDLCVYGTHTNTTLDDTIKLEAYTNEAQSTLAPIPLILYDSSAASSIVTLAVNTYVWAHAMKSVATTFANTSDSIPVPHGLKWTYAVGDASAVNLSLFAARKV